MGNTPAWRAVFYTDNRGNSPVIDHVNSLPVSEQATIARHIQLLVEAGDRAREPLVKHVRGKIWELRPGNHRVFYFAYTGRCFVLLHAYRKKTPKAPQQEIAIAERRWLDVLGRGIP